MRLSQGLPELMTWDARLLMASEQKKWMWLNVCVLNESVGYIGHFLQHPHEKQLCPAINLY